MTVLLMLISKFNMIPLKKYKQVFFSVAKEIDSKVLLEK